jgi:hypothetical protein
VYFGAMLVASNWFVQVDGTPLVVPGKYMAIAFVVCLLASRVR